MNFVKVLSVQIVSLIIINSDINLVPQNICCDCGDYSFSCIKKNSTLSKSYPSSQ